MRNVTIWALLLLAIVCSAVDASAEETLCDASSTNCRTSLITLINNETQGIDVGVWFFKDSRFTTASNRWCHESGVTLIAFKRCLKPSAICQRIIERVAPSGLISTGCHINENELSDRWRKRVW